MIFDDTGTDGEEIRNRVKQAKTRMEYLKNIFWTKQLRKMKYMIYNNDKKQSSLWIRNMKTFGREQKKYQCSVQCSGVIRIGNLF